MKGFTLAPLLEITERQLETEARLVKLAQNDWFNARARESRQAHAAVIEREQLVAALTRGVTGGGLRQHALTVDQLDARCGAARAEVAAAHAVWLARLAQWQLIQARVKALKVIRERWLSRLAVSERRQAQRELDEWSNRNRLVSRAAMR